jgi:hypothetical protein
VGFEIDYRTVQEGEKGEKRGEVCGFLYIFEWISLNFAVFSFADFFFAVEWRSER